jgi:hypothetical protein
MEFTAEERHILQQYRAPSRSGTARVIRLAIQYALGGGIFLYLAIAQKQPLYAIGIYVLLVGFLCARIFGARRLRDLMPQILRRYEERISQLEEQLRASGNKNI